MLERYIQEMGNEYPNTKLCCECIKDTWHAYVIGDGMGGDRIILVSELGRDIMEALVNLEIRIERALRTP